MSTHVNYDFLFCAKQMPALRHKKTNEDFDVKQSAVCNWLAKQPEVMQKLFEMAKNKGLIVYDSQTGMWQGVDYAAD